VVNQNPIPSSIQVQESAELIPLSVIIPVFNEAAGIVSSLTALQGLRASGVELILVDGESNDATLALASGLVDCTLKANRGRANQMNAGAAVGRSEILLFLHADTHLPPQALENIREGLASSGKVWGRFDVAIDGEEIMLKVIGNMMNWRSRLTGIATGDQAIFVRRADFKAVGGFPSQALMEDIELSRRLSQRSAPLCLPQKVNTSGRRWSKTGVWRTIFLMWRLRFMYWCGVPAEKLLKKYQ
jgi:rSAM/selenodomain-associated transferase 2